MGQFQGIHNYAGGRTIVASYRQISNQHIIEVTEQRKQAIAHFLKVNSSLSDVATPEFVERSSLLSKVLPPEVIEALIKFRRKGNEDGVLLLRGLPIDEDGIGPTPNASSAQPLEKQSYEAEMCLLGCSVILGEVFAFGSQYNGVLVQDLFPTLADLDEQLGTGSKAFLDWHTEDAFHRLRADFLGLLCLRSDPSAATVFASVRRMNIPDLYKKVLFEENYFVDVDKAHSEAKRDEQHPPVSILFGDYDDPYLRLDPMYMRAHPNNEEAKRALEYIVTNIPAAACQAVLQQGDLLFIDNYRVVHGRTAFQPKFDGRDRWLKRVSISMSIRELHTACKKNMYVIDEC